MDENIEVELDEEEQRKLIREILLVGNNNNTHFVKFVFALAESIRIICNFEGLDAEHVLKIAFSEDDPNLH